jgi:hypothetical protein
MVEDRVYGVRQERALARRERVTGGLREGVHANPEWKKDLDRTGDRDNSYSRKSLQNL